MSDIGIMGGTFNPVHYGHLIAAEEALNFLNLEKVLFIPNSIPPHKHDPELISGEYRLEMLKLAIASNPKFEVSDIELKRSGPSYSIDTVDELIKTYKDKSFVFITGLDAVLNSEWHRFDELLEKLTYFLTIERSGLSFESLEKKMKPLKNRDKILFLQIPGVDISSTDIRFRVEEGKSIRYLVPDEVRDYIYKNKFYIKKKENNQPYFGVR